MNRLIKFRVWNGKRMIYLADKRNDTSLILNEWGWEAVDHFTGKMEPLVTSWENKEAVLMQMTGLQDKNKVDIYEGDIIVVRMLSDSNEFHPKGSIIYRSKISWSQHRLAWGLDGKMAGLYEELSEISDYPEAIEVIGNIFEHPNLLKSNLKSNE